MSQSNKTPSPPVFANTLARLGLLPWMRMKARTCQVVLPEWIYDLFVFVFFPLNWLIAAIASRFPCSYTARDWPLDPRLDPAKLPPPQTSLKELRELLRRRDDARLEDGDVWSLFDSLSAPSANDMIGNWRGKVVLTGSWLDIAGLFLEIPARALGCEWGKRFFSPYKGDPLILILGDRLIVPVPMWGNVSMPEISLRGKSGATMTYDHQPWKDHFRVLDDGKSSGRRMMLGNWISREKNGGWFTLEELPEMDKAVRDLFSRSPY